MLRSSRPTFFLPRSLSDVLDGGVVVNGACARITNYIPDPSTPSILYCRPAATQLTAFAGFSSPGVVSVAINVGQVVYGMVATAATPGYDEPFAYNVATGLFTAITGVTGANVPLTQSTSGAWEPPTAALIGSKVIFTHPGFSGANYIGILDISNPTVPVWSAGNTTTNALPFRPVAVYNFRDRAYYAVHNLAYYSDNLAPTVITNASQFLACGPSSTYLVGFGGVPISQTQGGILAALIAFKNANDKEIWQIVGDASIGTTLAINRISSELGCSAPRTIVSVPGACAFMANDGMRLVDATGAITKPLTEVRLPFITCTIPSRACALFSNGVYRISAVTAAYSDAGAASNQDLWYHQPRDIWTGPHSFSWDCGVSLNAGAVLASNMLPGKLFLSNHFQQGVSDTFTENGAALSSILQTSVFPPGMQQGPGDDMGANAVVEQTIDFAFTDSIGTYSIVAIDSNGSVILTATGTVNNAGTIWGAFLWGAAVWSAARKGLNPIEIGWTEPLVFNRVAFQCTVPSVSGHKIGRIASRVQALRYLGSDL